MMHEPPLRTLKASWDLSNEGYVQVNRTALIDLAFRLAATMKPGFTPERTRHPISSHSEQDDYGALFSKEVCRLGDSERGVEITDTVSDPSDGMTPFSAAMEIRVYGLPDGWALVVGGNFIAPMYHRPNPARLEAQLPEEAARTVATILREEFGATVAAD